MAIPLEDFSEDIISKAQRGLGIDTGTLAERSGLERSDIHSLRNGSSDVELIRQVAPELGLDTNALIASAEKSWFPEQPNVEGLHIFHTNFGEMIVNAYLVEVPSTKKAILFDTGIDSSAILELLEKRGLELEAICLTHSHRDHVADLQTLRTATDNPPAYIHAKELVSGSSSIEEGWTLQTSGLKITALQTSGHSVAGLTYVIDGMNTHIAVVGDAMFAGSMGGGMVSFSEALKNNREKILTLSDQTVLCPGHGPLTTVGQEKVHNPFFPEFK